MKIKSFVIAFLPVIPILQILSSTFRRSAVVGLLTNNHNAGRLLVKTPTAAAQKQILH